LAAGMLGMAIIVAGVNLWYLAWLLVVTGFLAFMILNRGRPSELADSPGKTARETAHR
jgi:hypothetical protein